MLASGIFKKKIILSRNDFLKTQNTTDTKIYFIESGSVKVSVFQNEDEQIVRFGYDKNIIVALDSFLTEQPSPLFIQAIKKTHILIAEKKEFLNWVYSDANNIRKYITMLEDLVLQQMEREYDLLLDTPQERYEKLYHRNPLLFQYIPNRHIANYLRMSAETLSRLKKH